MGLNKECVHRVVSLPAYETVMDKVVPLMDKRNCVGSTAGVDGEVILASDGVDDGASFTTSLLHCGKAVKHIYKKNKQAAVDCPAGCKDSFVLPPSLFETVCTGTPVNICLSHNAH